MAVKPLPDAETLRNLLTYDPDSGKLYWRARSPALFPAGDPMGRDARAEVWNRRYAGREAFTKTDADGYKRGTLLGRSMRAHRVIWKMETGQEPAEIDHIDGDPGNNRLANLRAADARQNSRNKRRRSDSRSGVQGVAFRASRNTWRARITIDGRRIAIGEFRTKAEAVAARKRAERDSGFHPNHGR